MLWKQQRLTLHKAQDSGKAKARTIFPLLRPAHCKSPLETCTPVVNQVLAATLEQLFLGILKHPFLKDGIQT